jgi:hypothetical protein
MKTNWLGAAAAAALLTAGPAFAETGGEKGPRQEARPEGRSGRRRCARRPGA